MCILFAKSSGQTEQFDIGPPGERGKAGRSGLDGSIGAPGAPGHIIIIPVCIGDSKSVVWLISMLVFLLY